MICRFHVNLPGCSNFCPAFCVEVKERLDAKNRLENYLISMCRAFDGQRMDDEEKQRTPHGSAFFFGSRYSLGVIWNFVF